MKKVELNDKQEFSTNGHTNSALKALEMLSKIRGNKVIITE